jgi:hypothetical protein
MTANQPSTTAAPRADHAAADIVSCARRALTLTAIAVVAGSALHVLLVAPLTTRAAPQPVAAARAPARELQAAPPKTAVKVAPAAEEDADDEDGDDRPPPEPELEQIPVVPASAPQLLAV